MQSKLTTMFLIVLLVALTACSPNREAETQVASLQTTNTSASTSVAQSGEMDMDMADGVQAQNQPYVMDTLTGRSSNLAVAPSTGANTNPVVVAAESIQSAPLAPPVDNNVVTEEEETNTEDDTEASMFFEDYGINPFYDTAQDNLSTFAMDVDTGSYTLARSYLTDYNQLPPAESIRAEEFINFFPPDYAASTGDNAFAINMDASPSPFSEDNQLLLRVGIQGRIVAAEDRDPALLIFVIDVSGSMADTNRLELAKDALEILVGELREDDRVGIVIYANEARVVLEPTPASEQESIISAINSLQTEGSTYAEAGIAMAYDMALAHMRDGQTSRVILVSDGVANVGATGPDAILERVAQAVDSGITLSTIGVGMGNFNDVMMEQLANNGNGNYHYVDNIREARRIFVNNLTSTLQVIGYDAKIQVAFNPDVVARYRLIGYENRDIADELFRDDTVDAGEVGAGHTITALYEVELVDNAQSGTIATTFIRYEDAESRDLVETSQTFEMDAALQSFDDAAVDFQIIATVAEFSEILRGSPFGTSDYESLLAVVEPLAANYPAAAEITNLIRAAIQLR